MQPTIGDRVTWVSHTGRRYGHVVSYAALASGLQDAIVAVPDGTTYQIAPSRLTIVDKHGCHIADPCRPGYVDREASIQQRKCPDCGRQHATLIEARECDHEAGGVMSGATDPYAPNDRDALDATLRKAYRAIDDAWDANVIAIPTDQYGIYRQPWLAQLAPYHHLAFQMLYDIEINLP